MDTVTLICAFSASIKRVAADKEERSRSESGRAQVFLRLWGFSIHQSMPQPCMLVTTQPFHPITNTQTTNKLLPVLEQDIKGILFVPK